jgi:hypothetical protein
VRDPLFDGLKVPDNRFAGGPFAVQQVGGVIGFASNDVWVPIATSNKGVVANWNGASWLQEDLDAVNPPSEVDAVWGTSANDLWVAARNFNGYLYHRTNGAWADDPAKPAAKKFFSVWGSSAGNVFVTGTSSGWVGSVWRKSGASWVAQTLPASVDFTKATMGQVWGLDANHVYATASVDLDADGNPDLGVFLFFDGSTWTNIPVPPGVVELTRVHGTSSDDLFVSATMNTGAGALYHVTNSLGTWTQATVQNSIAGYGPVWSKYAGTALAGGYQPPAGDGALRVTTLDQMGPADTVAPDTHGYNPVGVWLVLNKVSLVTSAAAVTPAGFYQADCN